MEKGTAHASMEIKSRFFLEIVIITAGEIAVNEIYN